MGRTKVKSVGEQIACRLRGEIIRGVFAPGTPLREQEIAEVFGVSRVPIRQVFQELVHEGLLVSRRNKGVSVAPPLGEIARKALTPVRKALEDYALRKWFGFKTTHDFATLQALLKEMRVACECADHDAIIDIDISFHEQLFILAGLRELLSVWRPAMLQLRSYHQGQNQINYPEKLLPIHAIHEALLDHFMGTDLSNAAEALASHLEDGDFNQGIRQLVLENGDHRRLRSRGAG